MSRSRTADHALRPAEVFEGPVHLLRPARLPVPWRNRGATLPPHVEPWAERIGGTVLRAARPASRFRCARRRRYTAPALPHGRDAG